MLIIFEGLDGCGKSTQILKLKDRLDNEKYNIESYREPGTTIFGEKLRDILKDKTISLNPITNLLLFNASRSELCEKLLSENNDKQLYGKEKIILLDRFKASTYAYQGTQLYNSKSYIRNQMLNQINNVNELASFGIKPNLSIFLDLDIQTCISRIQSRNTENESIPNNLQLKRMKDLYIRYIFENDKNDRFVMIDSNNKSIDQIHEEIYSIVLHFYNELKD